MPLLLYLDDLRDCFRLLEQIGPVQAESDTHVDIGSFDDLLQQHGRPMNDLKIVATADAGTATAWFGQNGASITITSPRPEFTGVLHQLQMVAWRHWRKFSIADTGVAFAIVTVVVALLVTTPAAQLPFPWNLAVPAALIVIGLLILARYRHERRTQWTLMPMIWFADRPPSFLAQNRDQIVVQVVLGLVFLVLGYLLGLWPPLGDRTCLRERGSGELLA